MRWIAVVSLFVAPWWALAEDKPPEVPDAIPPSPAVNALRLDECVAITLARHPRLIAAAADIDGAWGDAIQARLYPNPRIDSGNPQTIGPGRTTVLTTGLTQEIITAGKKQLEYSAASEAARQVEFTRIRIHFEVLTTVRQEFFATLAAQRRKELLSNLLTIAEQSLKTSQNLLAAERVSRADVLTLRVERNRAALALKTAEITLMGKRRQLAATMGVGNVTIGTVDGGLSIPVPEFDDEQVQADVLAASPMVRVAQIDVSRTLILLRRAEVEPIPNVTAQGGFQYSYATDNAQALIGLYINVPIFNKNQGGRLAAQAAVARANANRAIVAQDLTKQLVDAMARFRAAEVAVKAYEEEIVPDAMQTLELVQKAYARGEFDIPRLLQTQRSLFEANLDYILALENRLTAAAEIAGLLQLEQFP